MNMNLPVTVPARKTGSPLTRGIATHLRVIGAVMMRELHTRYGRENIGYLWMVGEPLLLGSVIALLHSVQADHGAINPLAMAVVGYTIFIIFRGIVSRADGALNGNMSLMYHDMITVFDIAFARSLLELAGTFISFLILTSLIISLGYVEFPVRPLVMLAGIAYVFFLSFGFAMIIIGGTYEKSTLERLVHPFTYFMIPLSGAFYQVEWVPEPYRTYLLYIPFPHMFELVRYGMFDAATLRYVNFTYMTGSVLVLNFLGLVALRSLKSRIQLT